MAEIKNERTKNNQVKKFPDDQVKIRYKFPDVNRLNHKYFRLVKMELKLSPGIH